MTHGELTAVSGQDIQPVNTDNRDTDYGHDRQYPVAEEQRAGEKKDKEGRQHYPLRLGAESSHILGIVLRKDSTG
jgi:hypothetical protein